MAKNYTFAEAVKIIAEGTDKEVIQELGKRFPLMLHHVSKVVAKAGDDFVELASRMPEFLTANKVNAALRGASNSEDTETEEETEATEEAKEAKTAAKEEAPKGKRGRKPKAESEKVVEEKKEVKEAEDEYTSMGAKELFLECKKRGIKVEPKKPSAFYAELLRKDDADKKAEEDDDSWDEPAEKDSDDEDWDI